METERAPIPEPTDRRQLQTPGTIGGLEPHSLTMTEDQYRELLLAMLG